MFSKLISSQWSSETNELFIQCTQVDTQIRKNKNKNIVDCQHQKSQDFKNQSSKEKKIIFE
jgi:hypothetical protein